MLFNLSKEVKQNNKQTQGQLSMRHRHKTMQNLAKSSKIKFILEIGFFTFKKKP